MSVLPHLSTLSSTPSHSSAAAKNETPAQELTRRAFCGGVCQCVLSVAGAVALGGCSTNEGGSQSGSTIPTTLAAVAEADGRWRVADGGKLAPNTSLAFTLQSPAEPAILIADAKGELTALSTVCTHAGCTVVWQAEPQSGPLRCPCHASRFDGAGRVLQGPATKPLAKYRVQRSGDDAIVSTTSA